MTMTQMDTEQAVSPIPTEAAEELGVDPDYDMAPRWADDERETVLLDVPADTPTVSALTADAIRERDVAGGAS